MRSSFFGLNTLLRGLQAQQQAIDTTSHNIANANTDGYSRQVVSMSATQSYTMPAQNRPASTPLDVGTGVMVDQIKRQRDAYVDLELRTQMQTQGRWEALAEGLRQVEGVFTEPSDHGLQSQIDQFFNAWSDLSNNPSSTAVRQTVLSTAEALSASFNDLARRLQGSRDDVDAAIAAKVPDINTAAAALAGLNNQITKAVSAGDVPNDMRDQRDLLLDQLVQLTGATYHEDANGSVTVLLGGRTLVSGNRANALATTTQTFASGTEIHSLTWAQDGSAVTLGGGTLQGQIEVRDSVLPEKMRRLDLLASALVNTVNTQHQQGVGIGAYSTTHSNFFDPMLSGAAVLSTTAVGNDLVAGSVTVGGTSVAVDPTQDSLASAMTKVCQAIDAATGNPAGTATWQINSTSGAIEVTYNSAAASGVQIGGPGDTSNFLKLVGLQGAPDVAIGGGQRLLASPFPVPLIRAATLSVDQAIVNDTQAIAASSGTPAGDGNNANAIAISGIARAKLGALNDASFDDYYASMVSELGVQTRAAEETGNNQKLLTDHLATRRESVSGVSLDEEATQLIRYQRAYQAAARGISAMDEMLETIITRMGRVGT
jgi:flagellar hook-associated protein 1 FlgK